MESVKSIKDHIAQLSAFVSECEAKLAVNPNDFAARLELASLRPKLKSYRDKLAAENTERYKEVIELRFKGRKADYGSMPLHAIGALTDSFYNALFNTSKHVQYGDRQKKNGNKIIQETIDLRLEDIGKGSTILFISAKTSPDLFGNSIIQSSLDKTLGFLNSSDNDLMGNISNIGVGSIKFLSKLFKELNEDDLELDIKWRSPEDTTVLWEGSKEKILSLANTLSKIQIVGTERITIDGKVESLHLKGKMDVKDEEKNRYSISFPFDLKEEVKTLHVGQPLVVETQKTTILNEATGRKRSEYSLVRIISST